MLRKVPEDGSLTHFKPPLPFLSNKFLLSIATVMADQSPSPFQLPLLEVSLKIHHLGEGEGGMFQENSIETCILSRVKQITSPGWMQRQALGPGALGGPRGSGWGGRWEGGSGWGRHVNSRPFHFNV